jgi:uncharacterized lipoprotein YmbA
MRSRITALPVQWSRPSITGTRRVRQWTAGVCLALAACGSSPPMRYYILDSAAVPVADAAAAASGHAPSNPTPVRLEPVAIPGELDRPELVSRSGPFRLRVIDSARWAAPLDDQIRRVLSDDLAARLPHGLVADPYEPAGDEPRRLLSVVFVELSADGLCSATLRADWVLQGPSNEVLRGNEQFNSRGVDCTAPVPAAMSAALETLAERLAAPIIGERAPAPTSPARP